MIIYPWPIDCVLGNKFEECIILSVKQMTYYRVKMAFQFTVYMVILIYWFVAAKQRNINSCPCISMGYHGNVSRGNLVIKRDIRIAAHKPRVFILRREQA